MALEAAGPPKALLKALVDALGQAFKRSDVRIGREHAQDQWEDSRGVVQFGVSAQLFDWFFNGRTGYRAHVRVNYECGLRFNCQIIEGLRRHLEAKLPDVVRGRELDSEFEDCGEAQIPKEFLFASLGPEVARIWFCTKRLRPDGGVEMLPTGVAAPERIQLDRDASWAAPYREEEATWLEIKGAFVGKAGLYQPKDLILRARKLHEKGEA